MADDKFYRVEMLAPRAPLLLRRRMDDYVDEIFRDGEWQPTGIITDYMYGHDDDVERISEQEARKLEPTAFA